MRSEVEAPGSTIASPLVVQLQLRNSDRSLSLWQSLDVVQQSGLLATLSQKEIIMQEASVKISFLSEEVWFADEAKNVASLEHRTAYFNCTCRK